MSDTQFSPMLLPIILIIVGAALLVGCSHLPSGVPVRSIHRDAQVGEWLRDPKKHPDWTVQAKTRCGTAPFIFPTTGFIGYIWDDSFRPGHRHQGLDIFSGHEVGVAPIYAASAGYLSRKSDWKSSLIIRIPEDPLGSGVPIWTYYTHMADPSGSISYISAEFPAGTQDKFVDAGTFLGYQGNFSGTPGVPVGVHLHFSIVKHDGAEGFLNELDIQNTLDPSPYFGLPLNANTNQNTLPVCPDIDS